MTKTFLLLLFLCFLSCQKTDVSNVAKPKTLKPVKVEKKLEPKKIGDYLSDTKDYFWLPKQNEESKYWIRLVFQKEFVVYQFNGQCLYWFFTNHYYTGTDKVELLWSYKTDCISNLKFLSKQNGVKNYPKYGDAFCEYSLVNDSIIEVKYNFPEWVEQVNKTEKDSVFPKFLYFNERGSL